MLSRTFVAYLVFCLGLAGSAFAQPAMQSDYARPGVYVGVAGSVAFSTQEDELEALLATDIDIDPSLGLHLRGGYRWHPYVATELHFEYLSGFEISDGSNSIEIEAWTLTTDGKIFLATGPLQPFLSVGIGLAQAEVAGFEFEGFVSRFGGGLDFYLTPNLVAAFDASYVLPAGDLDDFDFVSLGWGFQFRF